MTQNLKISYIRKPLAKKQLHLSDLPLWPCFLGAQASAWE